MDNFKFSDFMLLAALKQLHKIAKLKITSEVNVRTTKRMKRNERTHR